MNKLTVKVDSNTKGDRYLFVFLPDGTKLPRQTELSISDKTDGKRLSVKFQYGKGIDNERVTFKRGKYYFDGQVIPGQERARKPVVVTPYPDHLDIILKHTAYFVGQFSCTDFYLA